MPNERDLIGLRQAAEATGIKRRTLAYAAGEKHLQAWYIGNQWLTTLAAVERWREHGKHTPGPAKGSKRRHRQEERDHG